MGSIQFGSGNELFYHGSALLKGDGAKLDLDGLVITGSAQSTTLGYLDTFCVCHCRRVGYVVIPAITSLGLRAIVLLCLTACSSTRAIISLSSLFLG